MAADLAKSGPVNYQLAANSLDELRDQMEAADESVIAFLKLAGSGNSLRLPAIRRAINRPVEFSLR